MSTFPPVKQPVLVIDVETSGFDPQRHACLELGAVLLDASLEPRGSFASLIAPWPGAELVPQAMAVNQIPPAALQTAPSLQFVVDRFNAEVVGNGPAPLLAGWNVWFDAGFLRALYERAQRPWPFRHRVFDVQSVALFHSGLGPASQEAAIKEAFGEAQLHRALPDAMHTARLLRWFAEKHLN